MTDDYDPPVRGRYSSTPSPGASSLLRAILDSPLYPHAYSDGIVRDLSRCGWGDPASRHCWSPSGAAGIDIGYSSVSAEAKRLAETLRVNHTALSVQGVIHNRMCAGFGKGWTWRAYSGPDPHTSHVHAELNDHGAATLTYLASVKVITPAASSTAGSIVNMADTRSRHWHSSVAGRRPWAWTEGVTRVIRLDNDASVAGDQPTSTPHRRTFTMPSVHAPGAHIVGLDKDDFASPPVLLVQVSDGATFTYTINPT